MQRKVSTREFYYIYGKHKEWLKTFGNKGERANLENVDISDEKKLTDKDLSNARFCGANLRSVQLNRTYLRDADLRATNLSDADLFEADLTGANLIGANLTGANLYKTFLTNTDFRGAKLNDANFRRAQFRGTKFSSRDQFALTRNDGTIEGIIFEEDDEERVKDEKNTRDEHTRHIFNTDLKSIVHFYLPSLCGPARTGRVLTLTSYLLEGIRLAFTTDLEDMLRLLKRAMFPELFEASQDEYALRLVDLSMGSVEGKLEQVKGIVGLTRYIVALVLDPDIARLEARKRRLELEADIDRLEREKNNNVTELVPLGAGTPPLADEEAIREIEQRLLECRYDHPELSVMLDHKNERTEVAVQAATPVAHQLNQILLSVGGHISIDGEKWLPVETLADDYPNDDDEQPQ